MNMHENCELKDQKIAQLKAQVERLEADLQRADRREENLKNDVKDWQQYCVAVQQALRAKGDVKASVLREALAKAAEVFEGYAVHHFLKNADEKAQANRQHAKMCRDALAESEEKP